MSEMIGLRPVDLVLVLMVVALFALLLSRTAGLDELRQRVSDLENRRGDGARPNRPSAPMAPERPILTDRPTASQQVLDLLRANNKIGAIKVYREEHGVGLKEAKEAVEAIQRDLR